MVKPPYLVVERLQSLHLILVELERLRMTVFEELQLGHFIGYPPLN